MDPYTLDFKGFSDNSDLTLNGELGFEDFGSGDSFFTFNDFNISGLYNATFSGSVLDSNGALDGSVTPKGSSEEDFIRIID
jgi:hypothetical protein